MPSRAADDPTTAALAMAFATPHGDNCENRRFRRWAHLGELTIRRSRLQFRLMNPKTLPRPGSRPSNPWTPTRILFFAIFVILALFAFF